ncbi:MAG: ABC transporter ATP-binding protein [Ruminococcaceae bacterium]|nr:ABC transporter ATP-binding protein [Oscillospiraceae bacterium]
MILVAVSSALSLAGPMLSGEAIKEIAHGKGRIDMDTVILFCSLMAIFYIISSILSYINSIIMIRLSKRISFNMRKQVFSHLLSLPISYFDKNQTGDIVSRLSYDIDTINTSLSTDFLAIITSAITIIGSFVMMIVVSPPLILVFAITLPISIWFIKYRSQKVRPLFRRRSAKLGELNGYAEEMLSGQKTIKAYNREETIIKRFDSRNDEAVTTFYEAEYQGSVIGPGVNFISNLSMALVSMFGTILLIFGGITIDGISKFIQYSRRFSGPVGEFANIIADLQSATSAAERIFRVLDEAPEKIDAPDSVTVSETKGGITFKDIEFGYEEGKTVISNFSLDVKPGSTVAIVGPTGAGKTTIANLLMRFYDPQSGDILLDGKSIYEITRDSLRRSFTMVLQDTWLFEGTIRDNIAFGNENVTDDDIVRAAKTAGIHDYVMSLKDGYNTVLSDDGVNISKGQKQLLNISRALLSDAPILILDEATSNVDSRTEQMIQKAMLSLMVGRTSFVIAHRLSTIKNADIILVIRNGQIAESGKHDELLEKNGVYASLYNSQFQN